MTSSRRSREAAAPPPRRDAPPPRRPSDGWRSAAHSTDSTAHHLTAPEPARAPHRCPYRMLTRAFSSPQNHARIERRASRRRRRPIAPMKRQDGALRATNAPPTTPAPANTCRRRQTTSRQIDRLSAPSRAFVRLRRDRPSALNARNVVPRQTPAKHSRPRTPCELTAPELMARLNELRRIRTSAALRTLVEWLIRDGPHARSSAAAVPIRHRCGTDAAPMRTGT